MVQKFFTNLILSCIILEEVICSESIFHSTSKSIITPWKGVEILPVFHNLESFQIPYIIDALDGCKSCSVSLRHPRSMASAGELIDEFGPFCNVGVSSVVSTAQVRIYNMYE